MFKQWSVLKNIIGNSDSEKELFLSLIDETGNILCANSSMQRNLQLSNPREVSTNFYQLLHPEHVDTFKDTVELSRTQPTGPSAELYIKNGYYHPMKWQVNYLQTEKNAPDNFLCIGYKLVDNERSERFNELGEKNYQLIVEGLNAGILFHDNSGELLAANKKAAEMFGTTLEDLYQLKDIRSLWDNEWNILSESGEKVFFEESPFIRSLHTGSRQSQSLLIELGSGEEKWFLFNSQPLFNAGETLPFSVVSNIVDITREIKLKSEIKETDSLFRSFLNKTPNLAWVLDEDATLVSASQSFFTYFGLKEESAVQKTIFDLVPAAVAEALYGKHMQVLESGMPVESIEKMKWADGTNFIFHVNIFPVDGVTSKKMIGGHAVNLADKFAAEKQLRDANERLLMLSRATSDAIWEWDMQTGQIFRNDTLMEMVGYQTDDSKGLSWWLRRIHPDDRNRVTDKIKDATDKGQHSWRDEYRFKCADGVYKHVQDKGFVVYENGLPVKMIGSLNDVSELKELEDLLVEEKLQRQQEISETVIRVQEKERTRIGHELHDNVNQILSTTKMFVQMLTPSGEEEVKLKEKCIEYLLTSIEEIRKLSKELVVPQLKEKGLVESIHVLLEDIRMSSELKIRFIHDNQTDLLSAGKKITLFRILQEQIKNILKYSKARQVEIYLHCKDEQVEFTIKDDGIGFDTHQSHSGIGLSNIHDRARFYNGRVELASSPGNGCILTVFMPVGS
jgi:PAS domain S-box-containing protein